MRNSPKAPRRSKRRGAFVLSILDPYEGPSGSYNFKKDTSHLLLLALFRRGYKIFYAPPSSLFADPEGVWVRARAATVLEAEPYFAFDEEASFPVNLFSLVLMRKDPPVDPTYVYTTQILSLISDHVPIVNPPEALRNWNEKMVIFRFPKWIPPTLVTADKHEIDHFIRSQRGSVLFKPLEGFAGKGVRKLDRLSQDYITAIDDQTRDGTQPVMVQSFLTEISRGEKRVFMIDGKPMGAILKVPPQGSFIVNPDIGGHLAPTRLSSKEKRICEDISRFLRKEEIFMAGVDLIGEKLTEINITSPGLVWEWNEVDNRRHEEEIIDSLERKLR